jgi:hypothetical protein
MRVEISALLPWGRLIVGVKSWHAGRWRTGNNVDSSLDSNVSSGLGNHPYHLGDLPNLLAMGGRKGSLYTTHSDP